jgi:flagellar assembly factor FliW
MKINTTRFGEIEIAESELIVMKGSILGFEHLNRFVLLIHDEKTPLWWLQSVEDASVAFVVVNPRFINPDFNPAISESDLEFLELTDSSEIAMLAIVTVRSQPFRVTANLRAPVLVNVKTRTGSQVVLDDPDYPIQYDILDNKDNLNEDLTEEVGKTKELGRISLPVPAFSTETGSAA